MILAVAWDLPRLLGVVAMVVTVPLLALAVLACRRPSPVRIKWDLARMILSGVAIVVMARITGVSTSGPAIAGAIIAGVLLGSAQGWYSKVEVVEGRALARKTVWGVTSWAAGVLAMQAAGIASRTGVLKLGQAISWLGLALLVGTVVGRQQRIADTRSRAVATAAVIGAGLIMVGGSLFAPIASAADSDERDLNQDDLCSVLPADGGFAISRLRGDACDSERGDCNVSASETTTCISARTLLYDSAAGAREPIDRRLESGGTEVAGLGDTSVEHQGDSLYEVSFHRDRVFVFVLSATEQSSSAMEIAREIDARLVLLLEEEATSPGSENGVTPADDPVPGKDAPSEPVTVDPQAATPPQDSEVGSDTAQEPFTKLSPVTSAGDEPEISSASALGAALAGLITAAAIGLLSAAEAGLLSASLVGRGRLSPGEAIAVIKELLSGNPLPGGAPTSGASISGEPTPRVGSTTPPITQQPAPPLAPPSRVRTVQVSGAAAEAVLIGGPGSTVPIPTDQQWDVNVSLGSDTVTQGRVGSTGVVRSVGPVVRGPDGSVSVSVEVDAFDPPPPPPPPPLADELAPEPPGAEPSPIEEPEPIPPPAEEAPPDPPSAEEPEPVPPLTEELPPEPPPIDELPPEPPPVEELPPEPLPAEELPQETPPVDEPPTPPDTEPDLAEPEATEETPPVEELPQAVVLSDEEIAERIAWGVERNRSPEDIMQDLDGLNEARGGTGPIEFPEPLVQVDTPSGPVTVTATEAAQYDAAVARTEQLMRERAALQAEMANLDKEAAWWGGAERMPGERLIAGVEDMSRRVLETGARIGTIEAEIERLSRRPDPMTWDFKRAGMATREEAFESWENRHSHGWHHDQISRLQGERDALRSQLTEDLGAYRTTAADDRRLEGMRGTLQGIEDGSAPPSRIDFVVYDDPDEEYAAALEDWRTRDTSGRYFNEAERLRGEIAHRESLTHVSDVKPAREGDRGTIFDRPARELARIAEEQDRTMESYREIDRQLDAAQQVIDDIARRGG